MTVQASALRDAMGADKDGPEKDLPAPVPVAPGVNARALAAACGASTGELLTTVLFFPVDLVKSRLQAASNAGGGHAYKGLVDGLRTILAEEGVGGLYTGLPTSATQSTIIDFITVYLSELMLGLYCKRRGLTAATPFEAVPLRTLGGMISVSMTLPLETVAIRVVTATRGSGGAVAVVKALWREGGLNAFWRGLRVSYLLCLNPAIMLTAVDTLRSLLMAYRRRTEQAISDDQTQQIAPIKRMGFMDSVGVGMLAKLATLTLIYPLLRGKVLLQSRDSRNTGIVRILGQIVRHDGVGGLYKGLQAQLSKSLLSSSVKYAVKEKTEEVWTRLILGARTGI